MATDNTSDLEGLFPRSILLRVLYISAVIVTLVSVILPFLYWANITDHVPTHFNITGQPDNWGGKSDIFLTPIIILVILIFSFAYTPEWKNDKQYRRNVITISWFRLWLVCVLTIVEWIQIQISLGNNQNISVCCHPISLGALFLIFGYNGVSYLRDRFSRQAP